MSARLPESRKFGAAMPRESKGIEPAGTVALQAELCIVIVSWDVKRLLEDCLNSIFENCELPSYRVIVVDNASTDGTQDMVRERFPNVVFIENRHNIGFPKANNQAMSLGIGRYVLMLNPDTIVHPGTLEGMLSYLRRNPDTGMVGCRLEMSNGEIQSSCARNFPSLRFALFDALFLSKLFPKHRIFGDYMLGHWDHRQDGEVPCLSGACLMLRRDALDGIGFLDTTLPMYFEDIDVCYRILAAGWRGYYLGSVVATHRVGASRTVSPKAVRLKVMEQGDAIWLFHRRHGGKLNALVYSATEAVGATIRILLLAPVVLGVHVIGRRLDRPMALWRKFLGMLAWSIKPNKLQAIERALEG
jgi:GT2 family glycosyltransferase